MLRVYAADQIFDGNTWLSNHVVVIENDCVKTVEPFSSVRADDITENFTGCFIAPAFIDLQIYGAHGKLLSVFPETDALSKLHQYCNDGGASSCMPTVATNTKEIFFRAIDAIREYWKRDGAGVMGIHLEGPWINPIKKGAHIGELIHSPTIEEVTELLEYGKDVIKIITLAPEVCDHQVIELILSHNIVISAGHSNATYQQAIDGYGKGITTTTHLFNAMSPLQHREPGLAGAAMNHATAMASVIPDGYHVDFAAVSIAKKAMGERLFVITDAVTETESGAYQHYRNGEKFDAAGILSGSALTMDKAVKNLVEKCDVSLAEALRMCSLYPARVMRIENSMGMIARGYKANLVVMNKELKAVTVIS